MKPITWVPIKSIGKAKLYRTAQLIPDAWDVPQGFKAGEFVSVSFLRKAMGVCVFQCKNVAGEVAAISEFELARFTL
jgi:hypothetical protein